MEGYDTGLINSFFGLPQFREAYGTKLADGDYQLTAAWQSAISSMSSVGGIFGLLFAGQIVDRIGYRWTMIVGLVWLSAAIFLTFLAKRVEILFVGNLLCGVPWGMFQSKPILNTTRYASDHTYRCCFFLCYRRLPSCASTISHKLHLAMLGYGTILIHGHPACYVNSN